MGLLLDRGFVARYEGRDGALLAAAEAVSRANAVFGEQLGVRIAVTAIVVNENDDDDDEQLGPNSAPAGGSGTRTCPLYDGVTVAGHGVEVFVGGISHALGLLSQWASEFHPTEVLSMLVRARHMIPLC